MRLAYPFDQLPIIIPALTYRFRARSSGSGIRFFGPRQRTLGSCEWIPLFELTKT